MNILVPEEICKLMESLMDVADLDDNQPNQPNPVCKPFTVKEPTPHFEKDIDLGASIWELSIDQKKY